MNPLTELVETEKTYVDQLAGIIRVMPVDGSHMHLDNLLTVGASGSFRKLLLLGQDQICRLKNWIKCSERLKPSTRQTGLCSRYATTPCVQYLSDKIEAYVFRN